jgi:Domain of unknown function (DUF5134)
VAGPDWLNDGFAAVMLVVALYSAGRLVAARAWSRPIHVDIDVAHVLMGVAMAGMLDGRINPIGSGVWEVVFSLLGLWFLWRCYQFLVDPGTGFGYEEHVHRLSRRLIHLVMSSSMLYMYLAAAPVAAGSDGAMAMRATGSTSRFVGLPLVFLISLLASGIWELDGIERFRPTRAAQEPVAAYAGSHRPVGEFGGVPEVAPGNGQAEPGARPNPWLAPRLEGASHIAMCITMAYALVLML